MATEPGALFGGTWRRGFAVGGGHRGRMYGAAAADTTAPSVVWVTTPGATIERTGSIVVDVTDENSLAAAVVIARFTALGTWEAIADGAEFSPQYADSTRSVIAGGYRYTLRRRGGWHSAPTIRAIAVDARGNRA